MTKVTPEIAVSLEEAGIGKRYHNMTSDALGAVGEGLRVWLARNSTALRGGTASTVFTGVGTTDVITLLARGLHLNGVGCKITPLVRMRRILNDSEFRETVTEIDCLIVMNAQDRHRCNPLHDSVAAEVEFLLRQRYDSNRMTILQTAFTGANPDDRSYWSDEFWELVNQFDHLDIDTLTKLGAKTQ